MTNRERFRAVMAYEKYDRLPIVHFGYWTELIDKWEAEGHLPKGTAEEYRSHRFPNGSAIEKEIDKNFGWDFSIFDVVFANRVGYMDILDPLFERKAVKELPNGDKHELMPDGTIILQKYDANSLPIPGIPAQVGITLEDRESWEEEYLPRLQWFEERVDHELLKKLEAEAPTREAVKCIYGGSTVGILRNWMGVEGMSIMQYDDPELFAEIVDTQADLQYRLLERALKYKIDFDYCYMWEDMTFSHGPLIHPDLFEEAAGPHYRKITKLLKDNGITSIIVDTDGVPEKLMPTWVNNGTNIMFPIEYGTWKGSFTPYREEYGRRLRGIGGVRKQALAEDKAAVDREIERIKPIVELGGYIPCPDHSLPLECDWDLTKYYVERMHEEFGG